MNLDADVRSLQPGEYRKLTNGITVPPASSDYANALKGVLHSLFGNAVVSYSLPAGTNVCVGFLEDRVGERAFFFVANSTSAANNSIYQYAGGSITLVYRSSVLDFVSTDFIDADIYGDTMIFTNGRTETYKIDVALAIAGATYTDPEVLEEITLIKPPPMLPVTLIPGYLSTVLSNRVAGNYFSFFYRYVYENNDYSVFSPSSKCTNSWADPAITVDYVTDQNWVLSGLTAVDGVTLVAGDRILVVANTTESENGIYTAAAGAWSRATLTAGDVPTETFVLVTSGLQRYSTVWQFVDTGSVTIGTDDMFWRQIDGPNYIDVAMPHTVPATVTKIEYAVRVNGGNELFVYREERPAFTTSHDFFNDSYLYTVPDSEAFKWNDSVPLVSESVKIFKNRAFLFNNTEGYAHASDEQVVLTIDSQSPILAAVTDTKTFRARKAGGNYSVGLIFKDFAGRHSGVQCAANISILDSYTTLGNIRVNTTGITPPAWADYFSIAVTKCTNVSYFLKDTTVDVYFYLLKTDGTYTYSKSYGGMTGTMIDISSLTKNKRGYTFSQGDRVKIYYSPVFGYAPTIIDVDIKAQEGRFIFTRVLSELTLASAATNLIFEIYTPRTNTIDEYFEIGQQHAIADMAAGNYLLTGDVDVVHRIGYSDASYSASDPDANSYIANSINYLESMNAWDTNFDKWVTGFGRSMAKSDSLEVLKKAYVRFSNEYIQNAAFFGLNTFDALDEYPMPVENGIGLILAKANDVLVAIHETQSASLYIGEGFVNTTNDNNFLAKTDSVIGDDRQYAGGYGCQRKSTVVARKGRIYFLDERQGVVVRRSQDGLTPISDYGVRGLISTLCIAHEALGASSRIIGGWDPQYDCYCLSFIDTSGPSGYTLYFHENSNSWVCLTDERPEFWGIFDKKKIGFLDGALWLQSIETNYNLFFGVQYNRRLEFEISPMQSVVHLWDAVEVDVPSIYSTAGTNEDVLLLYHTNGGTLQTRINYLDFQLKELVYRSSFFRDLNDINFQNTTESKYKSPNQIRGQSAFMVITYNGTDKNVMKSITVFYTPSMNSNP